MPSNLNFIAICVFAISGVTLFPYNFSIEEVFYRFTQFFVMQAKFVDQLLNILLFLPLGYSFAWFYSKRKEGKPVVLLKTVCLCIGLSAIIENIQIFLPTRHPSIMDVLANFYGGFLGALFSNLWGYKINKFFNFIDNIKLKPIFKKKPLVSFIAYAMLMFSISIILQQFSSLRNWDLTYPLLLGNERTGNRQWNGYIYYLQIANRATSQKEVELIFSEEYFSSILKGHRVFSYNSSNSRIINQSQEHLPEFIWRGEQPPITQDDGVNLSGEHWMETISPAAYLSQQIRLTNQFTLSIKVETEDSDQTGPARIVSLSTDPSQRNFTLGQDGHDLVFRLRTAITGFNGNDPELIVTNIFNTNKARQIVITYDGSLLLLYVDGHMNPHSMELGPGPAFYSLFHDLLPQDLNASKFLYYCFIFISIGSFLGYLVGEFQWSIGFRILFVTAGIFIFPLILEYCLVLVSGKKISPLNIYLSLVINACSVMACILFRMRQQKAYRENFFG